MKKLKNWDNRTWLSSKSYISQFNRFLKKKINLNKNSKILDIGCGRANIISALQKKYKFRNKPIGIDIVVNKDVKKNIVFKNIGALKYLKKQEKYDLILIKQTIHFFSKSNLNLLVNISKQKYIRMIRERYISCLLNMSSKEINLGISEIKLKYKNQIKFTDTLKCISYRK